MRRSRGVVIALVGVVTSGVSACSHPSGAPVALSIGDLRAKALAAGPSPTKCPIAYDVGAALGPHSGAITPGKPTVDVSVTRTPVPDPVQAQQQGLSVIDSAAAVFVRCPYSVAGAGDLDLVLVATPEPSAAVAILTPGLEQQARLSAAQTAAFAGDPPSVGSVALTPGGTVAVTRIRAAPSGDAALLVTGAGLTGSALRQATTTLARQAIG